ncbi:MAG: lipocalin-like domain-containing protein [Alphaproteobacteria bacterium]|nr:lipocalin-like domain-containing protein [Alphaproteobacteria bacterium]
MAVRDSDLIGAWSLIRWTTDYADGRRTRPFEPDPQGLLIYAADGFMSVAIHSGRRPKFSTVDPQRLTVAEKSAAFESYFHYAGPWKVVGDDVIHSVTAALNPNMIGSTQVRHVRLDGDILELSAEENLEEGRGTRRHVLTWTRASSPLRKEAATRG